MKKYSAVIAMTKLGQDNTMFTREALEQMARMAVDVPVVANFNRDEHLGVVKSAKASGDQVSVEMDIDVNPIAPEVLYAVPGFVVNEMEIDSKGCRIIKDARIVSVGFVSCPAEKDLPKIQEV